MTEKAGLAENSKSLISLKASEAASQSLGTCQSHCSQVVSDDEISVIAVAAAEAVLIEQGQQLANSRTR